MPSEPIGGLYRKVVIGKEQSHRTSFMTGHLLWQDRLRIEQGQRDKHQKRWYKQLGRALPSDFAGSPVETRIARDRLLWQDAEGPGSRTPDLDTLAGRRLAERRGRQKIHKMRALAASLSEPLMRLEQKDAGEQSNPMAELPLLHHEVCHRIAKTGGQSDPNLHVASVKTVQSGCYPDGAGGSRIVAEIPLRNAEVITRQHKLA
mmetsp:Transcript_31459/g.38645  ORF Transcript_31459/g.38645 Transcript_31459/m.38645 type:complete len:204 (+) Transcript_31459:17-628(+)